MTRVVDLTEHAPTLTALAAQVAAAVEGDALRAVAIQAVVVVPALAAGPVTGTPAEWVANIEDEGLLAVGPGVEVLVDGPVLAPRAIHVVVGERALLVAPGTGGAQHARLLDGTRVLADATFTVTGEAVDHLDAAAAVRRAIRRTGDALERRADDPYEATEPPVEPDDGWLLGAGAGRAGTGAAAAGLAAAATAAGAVAAAVRRRRRRAPLARWVPTHAVPAGGLGAREAADASLPMTIRLEPGTPVRLAGRWGDWAEVDTAEGWSVWVDGRRLEPLPPPA